MTNILESDDYNVIRSLVGVTARVVPDATIDLFTYRPMVEDQVKEKITDWETVLAADDADTRLLKAAVAAMTAALLCESLKHREGQDYRLGEYTHRPGIDMDEKKATLEAMAAGFLAEITGQTPAGRVELFTRDGPTRSGTETPSEFSEWVDLVQPTIVDWIENN